MGNKWAGTEKRAGELHSAVLEALHEGIQPVAIEDAEGNVIKVRDKDFVKMSIAFLDKNKITVVETLENDAGKLRKQLQGGRIPRFKPKVVQDELVTEETINDASIG